MVTTEVIAALPQDTKRALDLAHTTKIAKSIKVMGKRIEALNNTTVAAKQDVDECQAEASTAKVAADSKRDVLQEEYDGSRGFILGHHKVAKVGLPSSQLGTVEELHKESTRSVSLLGDIKDKDGNLVEGADILAEGLVVAVKESKDAEDVLTEKDTRLKQAEEVFLQAADALNDALVPFRRAVRTIYGPNSNQYKSVRTDRARAEAEERDAENTEETTQTCPQSSEQTVTPA